MRSSLDTSTPGHRPGAPLKHRVRRGLGLAKTAMMATLMMASGALLAGPAVSQELDLTPVTGETITVHLGVGGAEPNISYLPVWVAQYGGFFDELEKEGINVEVVPFSGGGAEAILALNTGRVEMNYQGVSNAVRSRAQGRDTKVIYGASIGPTSWVLVRKNLADQVKTVEDINNLPEVRWGITGFGSVSHQVGLRVVRHFGLDESKITFVATGGHAGQVPALESDRIEVINTNNSVANLLIQEGLAEPLLDLNGRDTIQDIWGWQMVGLGILANESYLNENQYVSYKVIEAFDEAMKFIETHSAEEILAVLPAQFQGENALADIESTLPTLSSGGTIDPKAGEYMLEELDDLELTSSQESTVADVVDNRFTDALKTAQ